MKEVINMEAHRHMETHRWNIEEYGNGIRICRGLHDKSVNCEWEYYVPPNDQLIEELAEKVTDRYCKDELLKEMAEALDGLRDGANEISNTYRHMPKKTRIAIGVQQIIDNMRNRASQVENMRCETCDRYVTGEDDEACTFNQIEYQGLGFGCFSHKPKEITDER